MPSPYDFKNDIAIKLLVRKGNEILLIREPEFNDWMPGRLGLPGGKPLLGETLEEAMQRKIKTEVGLEVDVRGIVKIINILMPQKNIYHILVSAEYASGDIDTTQTESDDIAWYSQGSLDTMTPDDFTEYYNHELIKSYLADNLPVIPWNLIQAQDNRSGTVLDWMEKGKRQGNE